jgi:hypothetical protein
MSVERASRKSKAGSLCMRGDSMAFTDFTPDTVQQKLGITLQLTELFPKLTPIAVPEWLSGQLFKTRQLALLSEKSRSEFIVAPVLIAVRDLTAGAVVILSGQRLDVDPARGLNGECDFILSSGLSLPILQPPLLTLVEAKRQDIESAIGQCLAQMVAARMFNEKAGVADHPIYGCVTTGEVWQFLRLMGTAAEIDPDRLYLGNLGSIMAALLWAVGHPATL